MQIKKGNFLEKNIDLFWKEYGSGRIQNFYRINDIGKLRAPFWNLEEGGEEDFILTPYYELCKMTQTTLNFIRNSRHNSKHLFYLAIILNFWPFITSGNFFNNCISIIYFMPILFILKDFDFEQKSINN